MGNLPALTTTNAGCEPPRRHEQDGWIAAFLRDEPRWSVDGDILVLSTDTAEIELIDRVDELELHSLDDDGEIHGLVLRAQE